MKRFYDDEWWGVSVEDKQEMTALLTQWGTRPQDSCPDPPEWPDFTQCMPRPTNPLPAPQPVPQRPPPLVVAPYQPLGFRKKSRKKSGRRGRGRGRRGVARGRGTRERAHHNSTSSSESQPAGRGRGRRGSDHTHTHTHTPHTHIRTHPADTPSKAGSNKWKCSWIGNSPRPF